MRFLIVPSPYENESLISFIGRISIVNKFDTAGWIFRELDFKDITVTQFNPDDITLRKLNELTGINETELWKLTFCNELNYAENNALLNKILFSNGLVSLKGKICPLCLKEKSFGSKIWDIKIYTTCAIHSVELITSCPNCNNGIYHRRGNLYKCSCGLDYRYINTNTTNNKYNLQRSIMIHSKIDNSVTINKNNRFKDLFSHLDLSSILLIYHIFYRIYFIYIIKNRRLQVPFIMNESNNNAINWIDKIFSYWPHNFLGFLYEYSSLPKNTEYKSGLLNKSFGLLYENLYEKAYENKLDPLVSEFENYLHNFWDNSNLSIQRNVNYDENKSKFISFKRAREKYKLSEGNLDKLLSTGYINYRKVNKNILINKQDLERFLELEMLNLREVAQYLNVDQKVIADFESAGFIKLMRGPKIDGHQSNLYLKNDVIEFIESIENNIRYLPKGELIKDFVSLKNIFRHLKGGFRLSDIIVFIMEGHFRAYAIIGESEKDLNRYLINTKELDDFCYSYKIKKEFGTFSLSEISEYLEIPYPFVERIVNKYKLIKRNGKNSSVLVTDVLNYKDTYVTLETLAMELNIDYQLLLIRLKKNKIKPVEDCFYTKRKIFLRNDIRDVDFLN